MSAKKTAITIEVRAKSRDSAGAPRRRYLAATVTKKEKDAILKYCDKHNKSVSAFLAELALKDARKAAVDVSSQEEIPVTLTLPARYVDKMLIFARLQDKSLEDLLRKLLQPSLQKRQTASALKMYSIRCWLSNEEHRIIKRHLARNRLSARSYLALLAVRALENG